MEWTSDEQTAFARAVALHQQGCVAEAQGIYRELLERFPRQPELLHLLGVASYQTGRHEAGERLIGEAIRLRPGYAEAYSNRCNALQALGRYEEALASSREAIRLRPDCAAAYLNQGNALQALGRYEEALRSYAEVLRLNGSSAEAYSNRANVLHTLQRYDEALQNYAEAIRLHPGYADAYANRGNMLLDMGRFEEALANCETAIRLKPDYVEAHMNRGVVLQALRRDVQALSSYDEAIRLRPDYAEAHWGRSLLQLQSGKYRDGWRGYEWRWKLKTCSRSGLGFSQPMWSGQEPLSGKTILLHAEQGLGDTIQFCRYVPMVAALGARVMLMVQPELVALLGSLGGVAEIITPEQALPEFDYHCPLLSLPLAFGTTLESIPSPGAYLKADPARIERFRRLLGLRHRPRVGLVWSSGYHPIHPEWFAAYSRRNIGIEHISKLDMRGIGFVSLQKGEPAESEFRRRYRALWPQGNMVALTEQLHDFADTAGLVANLDLVIAVDTSVVHLAAALGRPVWLLSRFDGCWRWLVDREDSPWYESVRIYRQERPGDWATVLRRVSEELRRWKDGASFGVSFPGSR